ncbi:MAG: NF041680 family putative transposase [Phormidesmis sp.]
MKSFTDLQRLRKRAYQLMGNGRDGLFDLMDAVLTSRSISSFVELSLSPVFQRAWSSLYKSLARSEPPAAKLMQLYSEHLPPPAEGTQMLLAGDHTAWPRVWSPTLKERTYEHQPQTHPDASPVTIGQGYSSLVCIPEGQGSWALPLLHERITSFETPLEKAAEQLKQVCQALKYRPLSLWDSEYGCGRFVKLTSEIACDKLMRLRPNRVLYGPAPDYSGKGRPALHGDKFTLKDEQTWGPAVAQQTVHDEQLGQLRLRQWSDLHFRQSPAHPMTLVLVERLDEAGHPRHQPLWLIWVGQTMPALASLWQLYLRRFCIEHWYRFIKQRLHWCLPHLGTAVQTHAWSTLMPLMSWQLWLARTDCPDCPLPWQRPMTEKTPGRVANAFAAILVNIGTPAETPKPRGKSPGWPQGKKRTRRPHFPTIKKTYSKPKAEANPAA